MSNSRFGFRTTNGVISSLTNGLGVFDADAQAFINTAGITDATQKDAISKLVQDFKSIGVWNKMKIIYPFIGGTANSHKYNLKDPRDLDVAYRLVFSGTWNHTNMGAEGVTSAFGDTKFNPVSNLLVSSSHLSAYVNTGSTQRYPELISNKNNNSWGMILTYASNFTWFQGSLATANLYQYAPIAPGSHTDGSLYMINRQTLNNQKFLKNSTLLLDDTTLGVSYANTNIILGNAFARYVFATVGEGLTDTEAYNYYLAVQTFQLTLGRAVGGRLVSDPDAQAFVFSAMLNNQTQADAVNTLVTSLKSAGLWNKFKAIYPFVGGNATAHKFNLKDPRDVDAAYRLVFSGGWTHSATGALPNGTNAFADTKLPPDTTLSQFSTSMSYYSRTNSNAVYVEMGSKGSNSQKLNFAIKLSGTGYYDQNDETNGRLTVNMSSTTSTGYYVMSRTANNVQKAFRNGIQLGSTNTNTITSALPSFISYIGATNDVGGITYTNRECAFATIGDGLSDSEITTLYNIIQTFQSTLGRQV